MKVDFFDDAERYYDLVLPFLIKFEAENNLIIAILNSIKENPYRYGDKKPVLISVAFNDVIKLVIIITPPFNLILSHTEDLDTIDFLIEGLSKKNLHLPGVIGIKDSAENFSQSWCKKKGLNFKLVRNERIYKLEKVSEEIVGEGEFVVGTKSQESLILKWSEEFMLEALPETNNDELERNQKMIARDIKKGNIFLLLLNSEPVSMARSAGKTPNGSRVSLVYTPPSLRRKGYATECVAQLSKHLLEKGNKFCFLFTDLKNRTSNSIYQKIGYRPVIDVDQYEFLPK